MADAVGAILVLGLGLCLSFEERTCGIGVPRKTSSGELKGLWPKRHCTFFSSLSLSSLELSEPKVYEP